MKAGATKDGKITALTTTMRYDAGAFPGSPVARGLLVGLAPYKLDNMVAEGFDVLTNKPRVQAYRAPGGTPAAFAVEALMDALAEKVGVDHWSFRQKNAAEEGDTLPLGMPLNRIGLTQMLKQIEAHPCWTTPLEGPHRGRGLALGYWIGGSFTSSAEIKINPDATASIFVGTVDLTGTRTTISQMVADELQLDPTDITITVGDTDTAPFADLSGGSRITYTMSAAAHQASQDVLAQLKERAAEKLKVSVDEVEYRAKRFLGQEQYPERSQSGRAGPRECCLGQRADHRARAAAHPDASRPTPMLPMSLMLRSTRIRAKVTILRYTCFQDVGKAINPIQVEGQIQGGAVQGIGWALNEEYIFANGELQNASLLDYRCPVASSTCP